MNQKSLWNQEYYEILEFYYWEPQHLGKSKNPRSKYDSLAKALTHIKSIEVSLNHQFNTFFSLLPTQETNELFSKIFGRKFDENFCFNSKATRQFVDSFKSATQPDLFFPSPTELVCIEMKVSAQSDFDQLMKYLLLSLIEKSKAAEKKRFSLLYLGKGDFCTLFREGCQSIEELRAQFLLYEFGERTKNGAIDLAPYREEIYRLSREIDIAYLSYAHFGEMLLRLSNDTDNQALKNIYNGLIAELEDRGFLQGNM